MGLLPQHRPEGQWLGFLHRASGLAALPNASTFNFGFLIIVHIFTCTHAYVSFWAACSLLRQHGKSRDSWRKQVLKEGWKKQAHPYYAVRLERLKAYQHFVISATLIYLGHHHRYVHPCIHLNLPCFQSVLVKAHIQRRKAHNLQGMPAEQTQAVSQQRCKRGPSSPVYPTCLWDGTVGQNLSWKALATLIWWYRGVTSAWDQTASQRGESRGTPEWAGGMWTRQMADIQKEDYECKELDQKTVSLDSLHTNTDIYRDPPLLTWTYSAQHMNIIPDLMKKAFLSFSNSDSLRMTENAEVLQ